MVLEHPIQPFLEWLPIQLLTFLLSAVCLAVAGTFVGYLIASVRHGPAHAFGIVGSTLAVGYRDLRSISSRRIVGMAGLAFREAIRRYVLVVFAVFVVILLFAGWYLDTSSDDPAKLYLSFVLKATNFLVVLLAIFLSVFSLPADLRNRTIYTVVTKPVRGWEIVIGRIAGFGAVGTVILALMCLFSYVFVVRGVSHRHQVDADSVEIATDGSGGWRGQTTRDSFHRHEITINPDGNGVTDSRMGHRHKVAQSDDGDEVKYRVGPAVGSLQARVPVYGELRFLGRDGKPADKGINVGKEWTYRGYVEGGSLGAGVWRFDGLNARDFPGGLPIELSIRVFRTYKGEIESGILGTIVLKNPQSGLQSEDIPFTATDNFADEITIDRRITAAKPGGQYREVDLFEDLTDNGSLEIWISCAERAQYFGMARTDLYLRAADRLFGFNFVKSYFTIWLQMLVVTGFGVMFSTFLNGAVAMLATLGSIIMGYFSQWIVDVFTGAAEGGGPSESVIRIVTQDNLVTPLDINPVTTAAVKAFDVVAMAIIRGVSFLMPNFRDFSEFGGMNTTRFVANGFDIPMNLMSQYMLTTFAYLLAVTCLGYFFLKSKEIAA